MTDYRNLTGSRVQTRHELLEKRMLNFGVGIIKKLEKNRSLPRSVANQLIRCSTSIGANYAEACNAVSKSDFRNKIFIAKKEAAETRYWIDLCMELTTYETWLNEKKEVQELLLILQTIVNTLKDRSVK